MAELDVEAHAAAQEKEYGTYVATQPIFIDGARAFNPGHPVPAGHVSRFDLQDSVAKVGTKAAEKVTAAPAENTEVKGA
jgi:hypothetical protein